MNNVPENANMLEVILAASFPEASADAIRSAAAQCSCPSECPVHTDDDEGGDE